MNNFFNPYTVALTAVYLLLAGALIGYPLTIYFDSIKKNRLLLAPAIGLAVLGVALLSVFSIVKFTGLTVVLTILVAAAIVWAVMLGVPVKVTSTSSKKPSLSHSWLIVAALLSLLQAHVIGPHFFHNGVGLAAPIFDHAQSAIINAMMREGIPPGNPFFQMAGSSHTLSFYYGWYALAAQSAMLSGASGWEADTALTGVTAFLSLIFMGWAAVAYSGRKMAAWWVLPLSMASTLGSILVFIAGPKGTAFFTDEHELESWVGQSIWVPQHLFAAIIASLAIFAFVKLLKLEKLDIRLCILIGILTGFSYDSSVWVGLIGLLPVLLVISFVGFDRQRLGQYCFKLALPGAVALVSVITSLLREKDRLGSSPVIAGWVFPVVTRSTTMEAHFANFMAYWAILLVVCYGFSYVISMIWAWKTLFGNKKMQLEDKALMASFLLPLLMALFLHSVIMNNDLGWRCVLISMFSMNVIAAGALVGGFKNSVVISKKTVTSLAAFLLIPGILSGISFEFLQNFSQALYGVANPSSTRMRYIDFQMWRAVDAVTPLHQAVANNPSYDSILTPWVGNISWALMSNRDSCTPAPLYLDAFSQGLNPIQRASAENLFAQIFSGTPNLGDFKTLLDVYKCDTLLVVPSDRLWNAAILNNNPYYHLEGEHKNLWRIYRSTSTSRMKSTQMSR